jgi:hypothetical protein
VTRSDEAILGAVKVLETLPSGRELADAYGSLASTYMNREDAKSALP